MLIESGHFTLALVLEMLLVNTGYQLEDFQGMQEIPFQDKAGEGGLLMIKIMMLGLQETVRLIMDLAGMGLAVRHVFLTNMMKHFGLAIKALVAI